MNTYINRYRKRVKTILVSTLLLVGGIAQAQQAQPPQVTVKGNVFGGGKLGEVSQSTTVTINDGTVNGSVFGGGSGALTEVAAGLVEGNTTVTMMGGNVKSNIYGGGMFGSVGSGTLDSNGNVSNVNVGVTHVTISGGEVGPFTGSNAHVYGGSQGSVDLTDTALYKNLANVDSTSVIISGTALVRGMVFGGGENGHVLAGTRVQIGTTGTPTIGTAESIERRSGHVFGGGQGTEGSLTAGRVGASTKVEMLGGTVLGCVYGGGVIARTGVDVNGNFTFVTGTGVNKVYDSIHHGLNLVEVSGGTIGNNHNSGLDLLRSVNNSGNVYGGGRGDLDDYHEDDWGRSANAIVNITNTPRIYGSVYGGGQMANVGDWNNYSDWYTTKTSTTRVTIEGAPTIGTVLEFDHDYSISTTNPPLYTEYDTINGVRKIRHTRTGNVHGGGQGDVKIQGNKVVGLEHGHCGTAEIVIAKNSGSNPNILSSVYGGAEQGAVWGNTKVSIAGGTIGTTGIESDSVNVTGPYAHATYSFGQVYGGGYGKDIFLHLNYTGAVQSKIDSVNLLSGRIYGNTLVDITGGTIRGNVYGGGDLASVYNKLNDGTIENGTCNVKVSGSATIIGPADNTGFNAYVFGGGRGFTKDPNEKRKAHANVNNTKVIIDNGATIYASVFGGCADGHVLGNTEVEIKGAGTTIGTDGYSLGNGNVYGGGGNMMLGNFTAGRVGGNTTVTVSNGTVKGCIYGGGYAGLVGVDVDGEAYTDYDNHGKAIVDIKGGAIGSEIAYGATGHGIVGNVFGSGKGDASGMLFGRVLNTEVNISKTNSTNPRVYGCVYGGGELASVGLTSPVYEVPTNPTSNIVDYTPVENTGLAEVTITGGQIGSRIEGSTQNGYVYGGGKGMNATAYRNFTNVNRTYVTIDLPDATAADTTNYRIWGCVFGGAADGHVLDSTSVTLNSGVVGTRGLLAHEGSIFGAGRNDDGHTYTSGRVGGNVFVKVKGGLVMGNVYGGGKFGLTGVDLNGNAYTTNQDKHGNTFVTISGGTVGVIKYVRKHDTELTDPLDSIVHVGGAGNVFGGGRGDRNQDHPDYGRVMHNSNVTISGGHVMYNVYGGGQNGSVGQRNVTMSGSTITAIDPVANTGLATVIVTGGQVGPAPKVDLANGYNIPIGLDGTDGYVFGGGMGNGDDPITDSNPFGEFYDIADVNNTLVTINIPLKDENNNDVDTTQNRIWGSVFGGSEDGHVLGNAKVKYISGFLGTKGTTSYDGNIFGAGRNYSHKNYTAGRVQGNATVHMCGGHIFGNIFGAGRLAITGCSFMGFNLREGGYYGAMLDGDHGNINVKVNGGTIGNPNKIETFTTHAMGDIFGGGKGEMKGIDIDNHPKASALLLALSKNTTIVIADSIANGEVKSSPIILGSVYGGGEVANVGNYQWKMGPYSGTTETIGDIDLLDESGVCTITVSGGTIGATNTRMRYDLASTANDGNYNLKYNDDRGHVFGGGEGRVDDPDDRTKYAIINPSSTPGVHNNKSLLDLMATVGETHVTITKTEQGSAFVKGSVYGGAYSGHVLRDTLATATTMPLTEA